MTSPYEGLLEHVQFHLGPVTRAQRPDALGYHRGFAIGLHRHPEQEMVSAATTGVRFQEVEAELPEEFVCSARPGQETEATYLVHTIADQVVRSGKGHNSGDGYRSEKPWIPETRISSLVFGAHPHLPDRFGTFRNPEGQVVLQFITLIPLTDPEFLFALDKGYPELVEVWSDRETDLLDLHRSSAV
ncbi:MULTISPECIES: suppressor of fused domain protein [unclassified Streptomyces]|uniref:suppressor of fused domain protein n=1 Tax=unclassified Streptomyces TaxID=2593676 RepID=UPI001C23A821|nr:suppressor of fused domain protein [Streptomyces sp. AC558_RSS880]